MRKPKLIELTKYNLLGLVLGDVPKIKQEVEQASERIKNGNPAFNCKKCGSLFTPESTQWIFYLLCDDCFEKFDLQKMMGRIALVRNENAVKYFEDSDEWIKENIN